MNPDMIKMITDAAVQLGGQAKTAFIFYVILDKVLPFIMGAFALFYLPRMVVKIIFLAIGHSKLESAMVQWRNELRTGTPGALTEQEADATIRKIDEIISERKSK